MADTDVSTRASEFWRWFAENENMLFTFERDQERTFRLLAAALEAVHSDLAFEFGPVEDGKREFVISAGGIKAAFPAVTQLAAAAPALARWIVVPFRPRRAPGALRIGSTIIRSDDVFAIPEKVENKLDVVLLIPGFRPTPNSLFEQIGFLLLDQVLGEFDVETKIGHIEFARRGAEPPSHAIPLSELANLADGLAVM